ncbi:WD repeat-containing protein on Y chromosome [Eumeta japonica]|uniref:WD repeat-containing protein on Y chromosome n=1 Tax=Eumeta variegata TaxID=151549 RepID=A0A4C1XGJ8_EUMVA|nr:WD repeat-containing protein on Y chromosome [Eumeta japonica]
MAQESETKSIISLSGYGSESTGLTSGTRWRNPTLHERCTTNDMLKLQEVFRSAPKHKLSRNEFRTALKNVLNVEYDDEDYNILFLKADTGRTGQIGWDDLVSHLMLGYFSSDPEGQNENLQLPIVGLPTVLRSRHRHPISKICFCPEVNKNYSVLSRFDGPGCGSASDRVSELNTSGRTGEGGVNVGGSSTKSFSFEQEAAGMKCSSRNEMFCSMVPLF